MRGVPHRLKGAGEGPRVRATPLARSFDFERQELRLGQTVWSARRLARKLARVAVGSGPAVEPQLREAPVMREGSWVGLDVHARSVVAGVIDQGSGELRSLRLQPGADATVVGGGGRRARGRRGGQAGRP